MIQTVALVALFAAGLTLALRATLVKGLVFRGVKPWACDLCMSWWGSLTGMLATVACGALDAHGDYLPFLARSALAVFGAVPVSMLVLRFVSQPSGDFDLPPSDGDAQ